MTFWYFDKLTILKWYLNWNIKHTRTTLYAYFYWNIYHIFCLSYFYKNMHIQYCKTNKVTHIPHIIQIVKLSTWNWMAIIFEQNEIPSTAITLFSDKNWISTKWYKHILHLNNYHTRLPRYLRINNLYLGYP